MLNVKLFRGSQALISTYVGLAGSMVIDSDNQRLYIHDGVTPGGHPVLDMSQIDAIYSQFDDLNLNSIDGLDVALAAKMAIDQIGVAGGLASLDADGTIPEAQLPGFVRDVIEHIDFASLPAEGEQGVLYVLTDSNRIFRWSGTDYFEVAATPANTDVVEEGVTNLYFTIERTRALFSAEGDLTFTDGVLDYTHTEINKDTLGLGQMENIGIADTPTAIAGLSMEVGMSPLAARSFMEQLVNQGENGWFMDQGAIPFKELEALTVEGSSYSDSYVYDGPDFIYGTTAENDALTLKPGEISIDTDKDTIRLHDGETQGGFELDNHDIV